MTTMKKLAAATLVLGLVFGSFLIGPVGAAGAQTDDVDGCTAVPDSGPNFDFTESCNAHDRCYIDRPYGNDRTARRQCDVDFFYAMAGDCRNDYQDQWLARQSCYGVAGVYYVGVRTFGGFGWVERNANGASVTDPAMSAS